MVERLYRGASEDDEGDGRSTEELPMHHRHAATTTEVVADTPHMSALTDKTVQAGADVEGCPTFSFLVGHRLLGDLVSKPLVVGSDLHKLLCRCEFAFGLGRGLQERRSLHEAPQICSPVGESA